MRSSGKRKHSTEDSIRVLIAGSKDAALVRKLQRVLGSESESEDAECSVIFGTFIDRDAFEEAVGVVRRHLGFEEEVVPKEVSGSKSKLRLNYKEEPVIVTMPVDVEAYQRFEDVAKIDKLHCKPTGSPSVRVSETDRKSLFSIPPLPTSVRERLKDSGYWASDGPKQTGPKLLSIERDFHEGVCRFGMSLSSHLLLLVDVISQAFNQTELDEDQYTDQEIAASINLVGPLVRMVYDQFSRGAVRAVRDKRSAILLEMRWPSSDVRDRFLKLPFAGISPFSEEGLTTCTIKK